MKADDMREMTAQELRDKENELSHQLLNLRIQKVTQGQLDNPAKVRQTKRELARVLTVLREKSAEA